MKMPRKPFSIQQVYIADGFADDCDELIHRCSRVDILNYRTFCVYYKDMNFASAYQGRTSNSEVAELSEEMLQIAKYYMVLDTSNFEESVAGLFLVYALLNLQPYPRFAALRIVPDDIPAIERIERVARRDRRHDVLYVLGSVLVRGPVQYQAVSRPRGMEPALRKNLDGYCNIDVTGIRPKGVYYRQNEELDIIRDMSGIFKRYAQTKRQIPGWQGRALSHSNDKLAEDLGASLKRVINGIVQESVESGRENMVHEIKKRAMKNAVGVVRHLDSASQRSPDKKAKPVEVPVTPPTPRNNIKQSPKRRPHKPKRKKTKKKYSSSSSEGSEEEFDDWCIETQGSLRAIEDPEENATLIKEPKQNETSGVIDKPVVLEESKEQEFHIKIDSLPPIVTAEIDGRLVEIEIIDEMKQDSKVEEGNETKTEEGSKIEEKKETENINKTMKGSEPITGNNIKAESVMNKSSKTSEGNKITEENEPEITKKEESNDGDEMVEVWVCVDEEMDGKNKDNTEDKIKDRPRKRGRPKKETTKSDDEIFKKPLLRSSPRLQTVSKRDMKKPILKSKFKKMGILSVANFEDEVSKEVPK